MTMETIDREDPAGVPPRGTYYFTTETIDKTIDAPSEADPKERAPTQDIQRAVRLDTTPEQTSS